MFWLQVYHQNLRKTQKLSLKSGSKSIVRVSVSKAMLIDGDELPSKSMFRVQFHKPGDGEA